MGYMVVVVVEVNRIDTAEKEVMIVVEEISGTGSKVAQAIIRNTRMIKVAGGFVE